MNRLLCALCALLALPTSALAWEPVRPDDPRQGVYAITSIADVMVSSTGAAVRFTDSVVEGCNMLFVPPPAAVEGIVGGRFVVLSQNGRGDLPILPAILFARAHGFRVLVLLKQFNNQRCYIASVTSCADAASCAGLVPVDDLRWQ